MTANSLLSSMYSYGIHHLSAMLIVKLFYTNSKFRINFENHVFPSFIGSYFARCGPVHCINDKMQQHFLQKQDGTIFE